MQNQRRARLSTVGAGAITVLLAAAGTAQGADGCLITEPSVNFQAISGDGLTVVGTDFTLNFQWTAASGRVSLGFSGSRLATNQDGSVISSSIDLGGGMVRGFRWTSAGTTVIQPVNPFEPYAVAEAESVSGDGLVIVGTSVSPDAQAFRWTAGTGTVGLGQVGGSSGSAGRDVSADGAVVVGTASGMPFDNDGFVWTQSTGMQRFGDLDPSIPILSADLVTPDGLVVAGITDSFDGFRWTAAGGIEQLTLAQEISEVTGISGDGTIVVGNGIEPAIWTEGIGVRSLESYAINELGMDLGDFVFLAVTGISDDGRTILGNGHSPTVGTSGFVLTLDCGACCLPDNTCTDTIESVCVSLGGSFQGIGTECDASIEATSAPEAAIPDGGPGELAGPPLIDTVIVLEDRPVSALTVAVDMTHTFAGDLIVRLSRDNTEFVDLVHRPGVPTGVGAAGDSSNYDGAYAFDDSGASTLSQAALDAPGTGDIVPPDTYQPSTIDGVPTSLVSGFTTTVGSWSIEIIDNFGADLGTLHSWTLLLNEGETVCVPCPCDWDTSFSLNSDDFFSFLTDFFAGDADFDGVNGTNSDDFFAFLNCFFTPPPECD